MDWIDGYIRRQRLRLWRRPDPVAPLRPRRTARGGPALARFSLGSLLPLAGLLAGCEPVDMAPSTLETRGPAAARIADLWWLMLIIATIIFFIFIGLYVVAVFRFRHDQFTPPSTEQPESHRSGTFVLVGGFVVPAFILTGVLFVTNQVMNDVAIPPQEPAVVVQVIGRQWWWEVRYPQQGIITANEIRIPAGQSVRVELGSSDVIHSFWVPQLHGKVDMTPGHVTTLWLHADEPGVYRGICAEYCGVQHALMAFEVIAEPEPRFTAWLAQQQQPASQPVTPQAQQGFQIFMNSTCVNCHAIQGTPAQGQVGPNLTHIASRRMLAAGTLENTPENLALFIANPQEIKPGNFMPPMMVARDHVEALAAYLASLE